MIIKKDSDLITPSLDRIAKQLKTVTPEAYDVFVKNTPVRSGRARRSTRLDNDTINANYPYARKLDAGSSRQSPLGMTKPMVAWLKAQVNQILRK